MSDANEGKGKLEGFLQNVPLNCGTVEPLVNIYIGNNALFDLLLGQPC